MKYFGRDPANGQIRISRKVLFASDYRLKNLLSSNVIAEANKK